MSRKRFLSMGLVVAVALLVPVAAPAQTEEANRILGQAGAGVLAVVGYGPDKAEIIDGSALALSEDIVVAAYHVVAQSSDLEAVTIKGKKIKVEGIVGIDKVRDIALLKLKGKVQPLPLGPADTLAEGARIFALGSNESAQITISEGTVRRLIDLGPLGTVLELSLSTPEQYRGGPLLDINGQLVGMLLVLDRNIRVGLPVGALVAVSRSTKPVDFKSWKPENWFETLEGATFMGNVASALQEGMAARLYLEKAVKLNPSDVSLQMRLARIYADQRDYSSAVTAFGKASELDPQSGEAFYGLGSVQMRLARHKEAAAALEKAATLMGTPKEVHFDLGTAYEELKDYEKAAAAYEKFISLAPEVTWNAYLRLGFCRMQTGQYDAAVSALLEAEKGQPKDVKVKFTLAEVYEKAGQYDKAEQVYESLAALNPAEAKSYYGQSVRMYNQAKLYEKAIGPARKIVEIEPQNHLNIYNLALMYFQVQKYDEAVATFRQVLAVQPDMANAWFQIGSAYFQQKKYKEAIEAYRKYTELAPEEPTGWLSIGVSYMYIGAATKQPRDFEAALEPMRKAVELQPTNANALYNLAIVYINLKDNFSAREIYNKLVGLDPGLADKLKKYLR